ncbi:MAG: phosphate ABC transporter substrate-binding protein, PhoT family [Chitinophagaceae bacterium]|nr:MAG: phosphate ABC transporter substrate-binding protein, PhoT family [Chitinophagaceae bacterium]
MARIGNRLLTWLLAGTLLTGCGGERDPNEPTDTRTSGTIHISADESFKPVIDSEIRVFEALHPGTHVIPHYKPEAECLRDFGVDSIRCVIATRPYSPQEKAFINDSLKTEVSYNVVAYDAIAVIVHPSSKDTLLTLPELRDLLTGKPVRGLRPVMDGLKATSTVRFLMDSVLRGAPLGANVTAADNSAGVIDFVARTPNAVGFLGVSWVGNPQDSTQLSYLSRIKVALLQDAKDTARFVWPAQYNIWYKRYPLRRDLVVVLKERHNGLGHGFANYMTTTGGQLIFNRAFLMPALMNFQVRQAEVSQ